MRSGSEDHKRPSPPSSTSVRERQPEPDSDDQSCDNDADQASQTAKRKRPISVSYVCHEAISNPAMGNMEHDHDSWL